VTSSKSENGICWWSMQVTRFVANSVDHLLWNPSANNGEIMLF
jgi:hypothetical protein